MYIQRETKKGSVFHGDDRRDRHRLGHSHEDNSPPGTNYTRGHPGPDPTRDRAFPLPRGSTKEQQRSNEEASTPHT